VKKYAVGMQVSGHSVEAELNYADCPPGRTVDYNLADWSGFPIRRERVPILAADGAQRAPTLGREGFACVPFAPAIADYGDDQAIDAQWRPAVEHLVQELTGADLVVSWAVNRRFSERSSDARRTPVAAPARRVHSDFSPSEFLTGVTHRFTVDALRRVGAVPRRWKCFNVWQPLSSPPHDVPLAVCDASSIAAQDLVPAHGILRAGDGMDFTIDLCVLRFNPAHRWYYFRDLGPQRALVFCGFDPERPAPYGIVPHSAFDDPTCPPGTPARTSIEVRTLAVFH